ncbi:MAG TPA: DEAD/DEAH box helicase [Lutibacter sp.]|nr:DEAD/DEAH box helicase [Lutibacter sp.]
MNKFTDLGLNKALVDAVSDLGFETPTPIQAETIPLLLDSNKDILGLAQTGTGKTAAFGLPSIQLTDVNNKQTQTIILSPTRELCIQISKDLIAYSKNVKGIRVLAVYGGSSIENQMKSLRKGAQIVVGTPGRTKDLINRGILKLGNIERVILDEADEMLTMGFKDDLDAILSKTPAEKQTLLFSATMPDEMLRITKKYMHDVVEIKVAKINLGAKNVDHQYYMAQAKDRYEALKRIVDINPSIYGIVFCRTRRETTTIANKLSQEGYSADALNGDLSQAQRDDVMGRFRTRGLQLLIATDVAARGIDINELTHVINFNLPDEPEIYTHRSGRTGRAGNHGISVAIINTREVNKIKQIERKSGISFTQHMIPTGDEICQTQLYSLVDKIGKIHVDSAQIEPFLPTIYEKLGDLTKNDLIKHLVSAEFNRFLSYYKNSKDLNVSNKKRSSRKTAENHLRLFINIGKKDNLTPARLLGLINENLDNSDFEIGKIDIFKTFSFFELDEKIAETLIESLTGEEFEGRTLALEVASGKPSRRRSNSGGSGRSSRGKRDYKSNSSGGRRDNKKKNHRKGGSSSNRRSKKKW